MTIQDICDLCALFEDLYEVKCIQLSDSPCGPVQVAVRLPHVPWWAFGRRALRRRLKVVLHRRRPLQIELIFQERFFE